MIFVSRLRRRSAAFSSASFAGTATSAFASFARQLEGQRSEDCVGPAFASFQITPFRGSHLLPSCRTRSLKNAGGISCQSFYLVGARRPVAPDGARTKRAPSGLAIVVAERACSSRYRNKWKAQHT